MRSTRKHVATSDKHSYRILFDKRKCDMKYEYNGIQLLKIPRA